MPTCEMMSPVEIKASFLPVEDSTSLFTSQHAISPVLHEPKMS